MRLNAVVMEPIGSSKIHGPPRCSRSVRQNEFVFPVPPRSCPAIEDPPYGFISRRVHGNRAIAIQILRTVPHEQTSLFQIYIAASDMAQLAEPHRGRQHDDHAMCGQAPFGPARRLPRAQPLFFGAYAVATTTLGNTHRLVELSYRLPAPGFLQDHLQDANSPLSR